MAAQRFVGTNSSQPEPWSKNNRRFLKSQTLPHDTPPPRRPHLLTLPKLSHQLGTSYSKTGAYRTFGFTQITRWQLLQKTGKNRKTTCRTMEQQSLTPYIKINSNWIKNLTCGPGKSETFGGRRIESFKTQAQPRAVCRVSVLQEVTARTNKWNCAAFKVFCMTKEMPSECKDRGEDFRVSHTTKGLVCRIH